MGKWLVRSNRVAKRKRGIHELYSVDPILADELIWGRTSHPVTRRGFLKGSGLAARLLYRSNDLEGRVFIAGVVDRHRMPVGC